MDVNRVKRDVATELESLADQYTDHTDSFGELASKLREIGPQFDGSPKQMKSAMEYDRIWINRDGLMDRPWFRNTLVVTDPTTGYGAWTLPKLRLAIQSGDAEQIKEALFEITDNALGPNVGISR